MSLNGFYGAQHNVQGLVWVSLSCISFYDLGYTIVVATMEFYFFYYISYTMLLILIVRCS